jgi:hypothetical protein
MPYLSKTGNRCVAGRLLSKCPLAVTFTPYSDFLIHSDDKEDAMSALIVIFGSLMGFVGGIYGFAVLDMSLLTAIAIWSLSGPASVALIAAMRVFRAPVAEHANPRTA